MLKINKFYLTYNRKYQYENWHHNKLIEIVGMDGKKGLTMTIIDEHNQSGQL